MFRRRVKSDYSLAQRQEVEFIYRCLTCPSGCPPTNINFCSFALCSITLNRSSFFRLDIRLKYKVVSSRLTFCMEKSVFTPSLLPLLSEFTLHFLVSATRWKRGAQSGRLSWGGRQIQRGANTLRRAREFWNVPGPFSSVAVRMWRSESMSEWNPSIVSPAVIRWPPSWPLRAIAEPQRRQSHFDTSTYRSLIHSRVPGHQARNSDENRSHGFVESDVYTESSLSVQFLQQLSWIAYLLLNFPIICRVKRRPLFSRYGCLSNNQQRRRAFKTLDPTDPK